MKKLLLAVPLVACVVAGCTTARPMMAPSGNQGFKIWCELPSQCYERAATTCPNGYNIEANEKDYLGLGDVDGNLFITCKQPGQNASQTVASPSQSAGTSETQEASAGWWSGQKPAAAPLTRYRCTDADGKPYVVNTPSKGCVVE